MTVQNLEILEIRGHKLRTPQSRAEAIQASERGLVDMATLRWNRLNNLARVLRGVCKGELSVNSVAIIKKR